MGKGIFRRVGAFVLVLAMVLSMSGMTKVASAAKKKAPKLSKSKVTVKVKKSVTVKVKNKPSKAKVKWSSKNKKIAKVKKGKITGVKAGKTNVICKLTYKQAGKKKTKTLKVKVTVRKGTEPKATNKPVTVATPKPTAAATAAPTQAATTAPTTEPTVEPTLAPTPAPTASNVGEEHTSKNGITTKDNGTVREEMTSLELMGEMGLGWNLGNQLEESNLEGKNKTVKQCETNAGNPVAKQLTMDGLKSYGINTVRIPVAWSNLMSDDGTYTLNEDLMNRVEEVFGYCLNNGMYAIINIHWDGAWWGMFGDEDQAIRDEAWKKYTAIWTQLAERYKDYSDHLIFEGANEELGARLNDDWRNPGKGESDPTGTLTRDEQYAVSAKINQEFVNIVRESGGNNKYRFLLIPGDGTILDSTCSEKFIMPTDPVTENGKTKLNVSVHYYEPTTFGIARTSTNSWGYRESWGIGDQKEADYEYMTQQMDKLKMFTDQGYGVIIGECGCAVTGKDGIPEYLTELFTQCLEKKYCPVMWDEGSYYNRKAGYFTMSDVGDVFAKLTGANPVIPEKAVLNKTGLPKLDISENTDPKLLYTWEGEFMRHLGADDAKLVLEERPGLYEIDNPGVGVTNSITDAEGKATEDLQVTINEVFWHMHLKTDWSKIEKPCIKISMMDNERSQKAQLQLAYVADSEEGSGGEGQWVYEKAIDQVDADGNLVEDKVWVDKYIMLDKEVLGNFPWVWITTNTYTGVSFVKIQVFDAAYNANGEPFEKTE